MLDDNGSNGVDPKALKQLMERYCESVAGESNDATAPTVEASLMRMMAAMGELSGLAFSSSAGISPFERDEVAALIGKLSVSVSVIAKAFHLDAARCTLQYLEEERRVISSAASRSSPSTNAQRRVTDGAVTSPRHGGALPAASTATETPPVVLSPASNERFFRFVDQLATMPREAFQEANLKWVAPAPNGAIEELIPDGRSIAVSYDDFPRYRAKLAQHREARAATTFGSSAGRTSNADAANVQAAAAAASAFPQTVGPAVATISAGLPAALSQASGYDPARESDLYSPSHFSGGLFSPMARVSDAGVMNVYAPPAVVAREAGDDSSAADGRSRQALQRIGRPYDVAEFNKKINLLRQGLVRGAQVAELGLTFSVPDGQRVVELINDGMQVDVTAANVKAFLELLDNYPNSQAPPSARIHRTNSVRKIDVSTNIRDVPPTFSPSHFSHGLFAPFQKPTPSVYVDYDKTERILPQFLREQHSQGAVKDLRNLYLGAARSFDYATLERIVREVKANPAAVVKYGVTFCVPSSLETYATPEEVHSGLHALFPGSTFHPVTPDQQPQFLSLVRQYFPNTL